MVFEVAVIVRIAQQKIGERKSAETRLTGRAEIEGTAGHIRLRIVIVARLELQSEMVAMMAAHQVRLGERLYCVSRS